MSGARVEANRNHRLLLSVVFQRRYWLENLSFLCDIELPQSGTDQVSFSLSMVLF